MSCGSGFWFDASGCSFVLIMLLSSGSYLLWFWVVCLVIG